MFIAGYLLKIEMVMSHVGLAFIVLIKIGEGDGVP